VAPEEAELLGAPLYAGKKMDDLLKNRCSDLNTAISRLSLLSAHDALILLKMSFSAPKMLHTLRCSPCVKLSTTHVWRCSTACLEKASASSVILTSRTSNGSMPAYLCKMAGWVCVAFLRWHLLLF